ncbi:hypothetical protein C7T36_18500 [Rhodococcus sp. AD45-ID]|uniref:hypothetical protein n=1 Tax=unclassified Rhodococcus (in: high G+C Gram-positive bacteria) TaxID=192944 RepID=UPI0005D43287|nr:MULTISPECIES: hypothetical protein [unclassified Rhodococcus (in: high G+C Gram-positive bacteria)]KJF21974.1 hypothetical protein SZ00_02618 [Rhodococcus sp. AD45]PSR39669.1 hypothetical protein C7T36_18500 [Rhodococcus sp. AD45-ID]
MINEPSDSDENVRKALAVLTAWLSEGGKFEFGLDQAEQILAEPNGARELCSGLISIAGVLLHENENQTGELPHQALQRLGLKYSEG